MTFEFGAFLAGSVTGSLTTLCVQRGYDWVKQKVTRDGIKLIPEARQVGGHLNLRVFNDSPFPIQDCWAYITVHHEPSERLSLPHDEIVDGKAVRFSPLILPSSRSGLEEDRLCWALLDTKGENRPNLPIYPKEKQSLVVLYWPNGGSDFLIASESGFRPPRLRLATGKKYRTRLKLVAANIQAKEWELEIDTTNENVPLKVIREAPDWWDTCC